VGTNVPWSEKVEALGTPEGNVLGKTEGAELGANVGDGVGLSLQLISKHSISSLHFQ
jgi:hypothetical protein